jgi:hypothetical protein
MILFSVLRVSPLKWRESLIDFRTTREEMPLVDSKVAWCPAVRKRRACRRAGWVIAFCHHH